jgi:drug/metabolite transporter (DMT)-like permease
MEPPIDSASPVLTLDTKVVLLGLCVAGLTAAGTFFQKLNGVREGNPFVSVWLVLATICFFPTFVITNKVFLMGGRMSLFVPVTATAYFLSMLVGRFGFGEPVSWQKWFGCSLILSGVMAIARG